jgi:hypothetical protein
MAWEPAGYWHWGACLHLVVWAYEAVFLPVTPLSHIGRCPNLLPSFHWVYLNSNASLIQFTKINCSIVIIVELVCYPFELHEALASYMCHPHRNTGV